MKYGNQKFELHILCGDYSYEFKNVSDKSINNLGKTLKEKGIKKLIHFTSKENVRSILKHGILSRLAIYETECVGEIRITDFDRIDGNLNAISVSITRPNEYMLKQKLEKGLLIEPYIIEIDANILLNKNMKFIYCSKNAAKKEVNRGPLHEDFLEMFSEPYTSKDGIQYSRIELNRKDNETTDPQAEILVKGIIPPEYFIGNPISWEQWKRLNCKK